MTHLCNCWSPSIVPPGSYTKSVKVTETPWQRKTLWETLGISLVSESSMICLILQHILEILRIILLSSVLCVACWAPECPLHRCSSGCSYRCHMKLELYILIWVHLQCRPCARCMPRTCSALTCTSSLYVSRHTILNHCADHWAASPYLLIIAISWGNIHPSLLKYPLGFDWWKMTRLLLYYELVTN